MMRLRMSALARRRGVAAAAPKLTTMFCSPWVKRVPVSWSDEIATVSVAASKPAHALPPSVTPLILPACVSGARTRMFSPPAGFPAFVAQLAGTVTPTLTSYCVATVALAPEIPAAADGAEEDPEGEDACIEKDTLPYRVVAFCTMIAVSPAASHARGTALPSHSTFISGSSNTSIHFRYIGTAWTDVVVYVPAPSSLSARLESPVGVQWPVGVARVMVDNSM